MEWIGSYHQYFLRYQYILSFAIVFVSVATLQSVALTLISKVAPIQLRKYSTDCAFLVILVSGLGRLLGDTLVFMFDSFRWCETNNFLCFSMIAIFSIAGHLVKKHYFFLI